MSECVYVIISVHVRSGRAQLVCAYVHDLCVCMFVFMERFSDRSVLCAKVLSVSIYEGKISDLPPSPCCE
jgi:hypothetical protein